MEFPIWLQIVCYVIFALSIMWMIRGVYINYLSVIFEKEKYVKAVLVSKVEEAYKEVRVTNHSTAGVPSPASGFHTGNVGTAYRLYFDIAGKTKELDVDKNTFDSLEEGMTGMLKYKGIMFYSFEEIKEK
ncbi:MAG: DUF2500 family protein [Lachnospira sp.]